MENPRPEKVAVVTEVAEKLSAADAALLTEFLTERQDAPEIFWVSDGKSALDYVFRKGKYEQANRPDVILLDLGLPRISGYSALKELKHTPSFADIPIIILTTSRNPLDRSQCSALGADAFFSKPTNLQGYDALVKQLLENVNTQRKAAG